MSEPASNNPDPPPTVESLQREIEELRWQLARKTREADIHREAVFDLYRDKLDYTPLTEDEARELMTAPRGPESIADIIAEFEQRLGGADDAAR